MYYVYILKWNNRHYVWYTNDLKRRLGEHRRWSTITTRILKTNTLVGYFEKETEKDAQNLERIIKKDWHIQHRINHTTFKKINKTI
jgi:predicted GIY-YIG superfamily endonuclease